METFEFVVTSIARVALKEHVKIQAEGVEDAITRIEDNDYYEEKNISNREGSTTITIRICRREILQLLQDVITNNNLFHLKRKWNKLMIKEPSASES